MQISVFLAYKEQIKTEIRILGVPIRSKRTPYFQNTKAAFIRIPKHIRIKTERKKSVFKPISRSVSANVVHVRHDTDVACSDH